jgi:hypothetical protein
MMPLYTGWIVIFQILQLTFKCTYLLNNYIPKKPHTTCLYSTWSVQDSLWRGKRIGDRMRCGRPDSCCLPIAYSARSWQDWRKAYTCGLLQFCCTPESRKGKKRFDSCKVCCTCSAGGPLFSHDELIDSVTTFSRSSFVCLPSGPPWLAALRLRGWSRFTVLLCACLGACLV